MAIKTWNATALTGGAVRALDAYPVASLADGDRAFVAVSSTLYYYEFDSTATTAEDSPTYIRPDDYVSAGVWVLQRWYTQEDSYNENLWINSFFEVNQEAYASGVITTGEYGHDMHKSISSASYTVSDGALTMVSGTLGQSNDEMDGENGNTVTLSVESGTLIIGATAGAAATTITAGNPYSWTFDNSVSGFVTITDATAAKGIKLERGSTATGYRRPEPRAEEARCYAYFWKPGANESVTVFTATGTAYANGTYRLPVRMVSNPTVSPTASGNHALSTVADGSNLAGTLSIFGADDILPTLRFTLDTGTFTVISGLGAVKLSASTEFDARP